MTTAHISSLLDRLHTISESPLLEAKGHLDHPEDLVFIEGSSGARRALQAMIDTVKNPGAITIKWDGYPALIWGRDAMNRFSIMDKHMFNKGDGSGRLVYSPEQFVKYDRDRGVDRSELHRIISTIWSGLELETPGQGYYWGDLLFSTPLRPESGLYKFRANPNGIAYTVEVDSEMGKFLGGKQAGIVVHQYIDRYAKSTDDAKPLDGTLGQLTNKSDVAIVPAKMPIQPKLKISAGDVAKIRALIDRTAPSIDALLEKAPQAAATFRGLFTTYVNKRIVGGDLSDLIEGFMEYYRSRPHTDKMRAKLDAHLQSYSDGIRDLFTVWITLYNLKMKIVEQLNKAAQNSPVKGYLQDGTQTQEGFVSHGLKFVDRMGFSRQNLAGR